ncbi:UNVERIFIED_CONTAM: hypothetical protein K2H54_005947 [Gekko kuhli]
MPPKKPEPKKAEPKKEEPKAAPKLAPAAEPEPRKEIEFNPANIKVRVGAWLDFHAEAIDDLAATRRRSC